MNPGIQSLWIILTVMIPGVVSYGIFRIIISILKIYLPIISNLEQSETTSICVILAIMFLLQLVGITTETIAYRFGPYKHKNKELQKAFDKRYEIISKLDPKKDYHVERILGQFFMSHNISIGMIINLIWVIIYEFIIVKANDLVTFMIIICLFIITILSIYVAINRFNQASKVLLTHIHKL